MKRAHHPRGGHAARQPGRPPSSPAIHLAHRRELQRPRDPRVGGILPLDADSRRVRLSVELVVSSRIEDPEGSWTLPSKAEREQAIQRWTLAVDLARPTGSIGWLACTSPESPIGSPRASDSRGRVSRGSRRPWTPIARRGARAGMPPMSSSTAIRRRSGPSVCRVSPHQRGESRRRARLHRRPRAQRRGYKGHVFWDTEIFMLRSSRSPTPRPRVPC